MYGETVQTSGAMLSMEMLWPELKWIGTGLGQLCYNRSHDAKPREGATQRRDLVNKVITRRHSNASMPHAENCPVGSKNWPLRTSSRLHSPRHERSTHYMQRLALHT